MAGMTDDHPQGSGRVVLSATRVWLPLAIAVAGVVLIVIGHGTTPTGQQPLAGVRGGRRRCCSSR